MLRRALLPGLLLVSACMPSGGGPSPRAVLVISSRDYPVEQVVGVLDSTPRSLDARVDKSKETRVVGNQTLPRFPMYEVAFWYPFNRSDFYGVALVKWFPGGEETNDRYFVDVYAEDAGCSLCSAVKAAFDEHHIAYFSACEHPENSTKYERIRCGT
jgi:hypothetical protein